MVYISIKFESLDQNILGDEKNATATSILVVTILKTYLQMVSVKVGLALAVGTHRKEARGGGY